MAIRWIEAAGPADFYVGQRVAGALAAFNPNPGIYETHAVINGAWQDYNALQIELRRQSRGRVLAAINYSLSRTRSSSAAGNDASRFEPLPDNNRPQLNSGRATYNITHVINSVYTRRHK